MRFGAIAAIQVLSTAVSAALGISLAWIGQGYWSLVWMQVAAPVVALVLTWSISRWRPQLPTRRSGIRPLVTFGANLTASSFIYSIASGVDSLLIGRFYGAGPVGLYTRAAALLRRPLDQMLTPVNAVFIPVLSRLQSQPERYRRAFLQVYEAIVLASLLVSALGFALARPLTLVLLGPAWIDAAPIVAAFSLAAFVTPLAATCSWLFESQGRGRDTLITSWLTSAVGIVSFLAGLPFGPAGVAVAFSVSAVVVQLPLYYHQAGRHGPVDTPSLWAGLLRQAGLWPVAGGAAFGAAKLLGSSPALWQLAAGGTAGLLAGAAFIVAYPPSRHPAGNLLAALRDWRRGRAAAAGLPARQPV